MIEKFQQSDSINSILFSLNYSGERVLLMEHARMSFADIAGSEVELIFYDDRIKCKVSVPESSGDILWIFDVNDKQINGGSNLEALIYRTRVALNGKW